MRAIFAIAIAGCGFAPVISPAENDATVAADATAGSGSGSGSSGCPDVDADGICDAQDDWPCGVKPMDPGAFHARITGQGAFEVNNVKLQNQNARFAVIHPNQSVAIGLDYGVHVSCTITTTCRAQLEVGTDTGGKQGCIFDGNVIGDGFSVGTGTGTWTTTTPFVFAGRYELRVMPVKSGSCTSSWAAAAPDGNETIGYVCVHN